MAASRMAAAASNTPRPTGPHLDTLANAPAELRQIMNDHDEAMRGLRGQATSDTTAERDRIKKLAEPVQARTQQRIDDLASRVDTAHEALRTAAERALPKPAGGVEGLMGRQVQWQRAKTMLDAGVSPSDVITESTDPEMLHTLSDELPAYLRSQGASAEGAQAAVPAVYDRLAEVTGGQAADARVAARTGDVHRAGLGPLVRAATTRTAGGPFAGPSDITAGVNAQYARESVAKGGLPQPADVDRPDIQPGEVGGRVAASMRAAAKPQRQTAPAPGGDAA
jgi:hypothetical protein